MNKKTIAGSSIVVCALSLGGLFLFHLFTANSSATATENNAPDPYSLKDKDTISANNDALKTADVRTTTVEAHDLPVTLTLTGRSGLDLENVTHVHAQFGGKVKEVKPELGDMVSGPGATTQPTMLCVIESNDLAQAKAGYLQAKVQLKLDQENLDRTKELVKSTVLAEKFLMDAQSAVTKDAALQEAARQQLLVFGLNQSQIDQIETEQGKQRMDYIIASPRSGVVAEKGIATGEIADPTINLFTIADTSRVWVWGDVYERDLKRIKVGQHVSARFASDSDRIREFTIDWISPVLDPNTHSIKVRGTLDNRDGKLLADMYCTLQVSIDPGSNAIVVPAKAVVHAGTDAFVFVQTGAADGTTSFRRTPVTVDSVDVGFGTTDTAAAAPQIMVRIAKGIEAGQVIVESGALGLFEEMNQHAQ